MNSSSFWLLAFVFCLSVCHPAFAAPKKNKCTLDPATVRCSTEYTDPVCAFFKGDGCDSKICQRQEPNPCIACVNTPVKYYVEGQCTGDKVYCGYTRPSFCTREYFPVCAYYSKESQQSVSRTPAGNRCSACSDPNVEYYVVGQCPKSK